MIWPFAKTTPPPPPPKAEEEAAVSEASALYTKGEFEKYNPDDLIGYKGWRIYERMAQDEQVKAGLKFKRDAIISRGYFFELDAERAGISKEEAERRVRIFDEVIKQMPGSFDDALLGILSAMKFGFSLSEKVRQDIQVDGLTYRGLRALKLKPSRTFRFKVDEFGNVHGLTQSGVRAPATLDYTRFVHYVVNPDVDAHYGESELRACYRAWWSKDVAIKFRNIFLERHASGRNVLKTTGKSAANVTVGSAQWTQLQDILKSLNAHSPNLFLPKDFELESQVSSSKGEAFEKAIEQCDMQIARALLLPSMLGISPQGSTGGYSQSQTQLDAFFWTVGTDADRLAECLQEQVFRPLGLENFGDEAIPQFKWASLSQTKAVEIIKLFMDLVGHNVLTATEDDETFIREALELPGVKAVTDSDERGASDGDGDTPDSDSDAPVASTALNGIQIKALSDIIAQVASGSMSVETARTLTEISFPGVPVSDIDRLLASISIQPTDDSEDTSQEPGSEDPPQDEQDETLIGDSQMRIISAAFDRAKSRVNFARISRVSEDTVGRYVDEIGSINAEILTALIQSARDAGEDLSADVTANTDVVVVGRPLMRRLRRRVESMLKQAEKLGREEAAKEIDKAMRKQFSRDVNQERLDMIAADYWTANSHRISGDLTDEMQKLVSQEILNGAKFGKSWDEIEGAVYRLATSKGLLSIDEARQALGEALDVANPDARLRTIVRTSTFDAINVARDAYFTDPQLDGYVRAYEYSAILDSRVTDVCRHLDEDGTGDHSVEWYAAHPEYKPPNHFNCRSLLIPVTIDDIEGFVEGGDPQIQPQQGFS